MSAPSPFLFDAVEEHAGATPDALAIGTPDDGWATYGDLQRLVAAVADRLAGAGVAPGDFVIVILPATVLTVAVGLAVQRLGAVCVELNRDLGTSGFTDIVHKTSPAAVVVESRDVNQWREVIAAQPVRRLFVVPRDDQFVDDLPAPLEILTSTPSTSAMAPAPGVRHASDPALLMYTSGSTGTPRGVIQTHANIDANTRAIVRYLGLTDTDRAMATLPLAYCYGRSVLQTHLFVGGSVFFDHRFVYPRVVLDELARQRCTGFAGVPLTFESVRRQVDVAALELTSLRYVTQAGGRMHPDTVRWTRQAFAPAHLFVMYGQTEATSRLAYLAPEHAEEKEGSVGRAIDNVELSVVDDAGERVQAGVIGNVVARGPSITPGYFRAPEDTASILRDGWLWTGDLGHLDEDGFLYLTGRTKDFLKLGGNRVSTAEIEDTLLRHPAVGTAAVVGFVDDDGAEQAVAIVTRQPGTTVGDQELRRHCRQALPSYKVPKFVLFRASLPLTTSGKIAKSALKQWINDDPTLLQERTATGSRGDRR